MKHIGYQPEIDGLRALAVLCVIAYHLGIEAIPGGFLGVDVFFVISGYLITSIILSDIEQDRFSLVQFYERRARRLFPALFLVLVISSIAALLLLLPYQVDFFFKSLLSSIFFVSNIFFWQESGYFAVDAKLQPLLHTWSLAVEEQFYIVFPLFLLLLAKSSFKVASSKVLIGIFLLLASVSLCLAEWATWGPRSAGFFLPITRAWELLIGALFACLPNPVSKNLLARVVYNITVVCAFLIICISMLLVDEFTRHPGSLTLPVVVASALLIRYSPYSTVSRFILGNKAAVSVGLISYSLYLWHYPLISFWRLKTGTDLSMNEQAILLMISIVFASVSWRFVEQKYRGSLVPSRIYFRRGLVNASIIVLLGFSSIASRGFEDAIIKFRLTDEEVRRYQLISSATQNSLADQMYDDECKFSSLDTLGLPQERYHECFEQYGGATLVVGDSHAMNLFNILANSSNPFVVGLVAPACRVATLTENNCFLRDLPAWLESNSSSVDYLIYHQSGSHFMRGKRGRTEPRLEDPGITVDDVAIKSTLSYLYGLREQLTGVNLLFLGPFVEYRLEPAAQVNNVQFTPVRSQEIFDSLENSIVMEVSEFPRLNYVPFERVIEIPISPFVGDCFLWRDGDHLSKCGEEHLARTVLPIESWSE